AETVLGDPIEKNGSTEIPIVSYGFGAGGTEGVKSGDDGGTGGVRQVRICLTASPPNFLNGRLTRLGINPAPVTRCRRGSCGQLRY
ncbi:MAG: hypothetical protein ACJAUW_002152, partial [Yoonia sp.]